MRIVFLFLILSSLFFSACRKNKELVVEIKGRITNSGDQSSAAGVTVKVKFQEIGSGSISSAFKTIATTTTDASGNYSVSFDKPAAAEYRFELSSPRHFANEINESADAFSANESNTRNFELDPVSFFSVRLKNNSPVGVQDQIIFQNTSESYSCSSCCGNTPVIRQGMTVDTTFVCRRKGGRLIRFSWTVTKGGMNQFYTDSVITPNYDTTYRLISY